MRAWACLIVALALCLLQTRDAEAAQYYLMLGSKVVAFDHPPVVELNGQNYLTSALLDELGLGKPEPTLGQDELPPGHYDPDEGIGGGNLAPGSQGDATEVSLIAAPPADHATPVKSGRRRYRIANHILDVSLPGMPAAAELDGNPLGLDTAISQGMNTYLAADELSNLGLHLAFNSLHDLYQVVGLIYRVEYQKDRSEMVLHSLTPISLEGVQVDDGLVTLIAEGGFLAPTEPIDVSGDPAVTRLGFKSQPQLGRSFIFVKQPRRTGFKIDTEDSFGYSRIRFGNYFQVATPQLTSSGEIALNIQLGAPTNARHELIANPWRLVVDFPGAIFDEATLKIPVDIGVVERVRVGKPEPGTVRVVLDLKEKADYRILRKDNGARYYIQLLPYRKDNATDIGRRQGRTIMLDPGHGGSDPGAEGAIRGVWEAQLNLEISALLRRELESLGYHVITTRDQDRFVSLGSRADYANSALPYIFVSIHNNSHPNSEMSGAMTFYHPTSSSGPQLARLVQHELTAATGFVDKGIRQANFFVLRETAVPSVLVECGFLTNREECRSLTSPATQLAIAQAVARGIDYFVTGGF